MSSKIEDLVANLAEQYEETARGPSPGWIGAEVVAKQLRSILAAPVVERQPFAYYFRFAGYVTADGPQGWRTEIEIEKPAEFLFADGRVQDFTPLYTATPELAELQAKNEQLGEAHRVAQKQLGDRWAYIKELQASIARLTAENDRLQMMFDEETDRVEIAVGLQQKAIKGRDKYAAEIERLKAGQGEPVSKQEAATLIASHLAPGRSEGHVAEVASAILALVSEPVSVVVLPVRMIGDTASCIGWNACLDKVKELNQ